MIGPSSQLARRHVGFAAVLAGLCLTVNAACTGSPAPASEQESQNPAPAIAQDGSPPSSDTATSSAPAPTGSCEVLEMKFDVGDRALTRACEAKEDCSLLWSEFNCYALHGKSDDLASLRAIDAAMEARGCSPVECEPPPMVKCDAGRCTWDL